MLANLILVGFARTSAGDPASMRANVIANLTGEAKDPEHVYEVLKRASKTPPKTCAELIAAVDAGMQQRRRHGTDLLAGVAVVGAGIAAVTGGMLIMSGAPKGPVAPPLPTYAETVGGPSNTWSDYVHAGGTGGPEILNQQTVQISCVIQGFKVADGNANWYRIASSPWNEQFYVSADAFYNGFPVGGSLKGTPYVDPKVRAC
jgi:hypothetical protein